MLKPGNKAPEFSLPDQDGVTFMLYAELTHGPLVLFFYPADFTPVCTAEVCMFRDEHARLADAGLRVVGVSPQSSASHQKFRDEYSLPYRLLSDPDRRVIATYAGSIGGLKLPMITRRVTYLIASDGVVAERVIAAFSAERHRAIIESASALLSRA